MGLEPYADDARQALRQIDAMTYLLQYFLVRPACYMDLVGLLHTVSRMRQPIGQLAVVGDQDQSFTVDVESADIVDASDILGNHIDHAGSARWITCRADNTSWLVDRIGDQFWACQWLAVNTDFLSASIHSGSKRGDHLAIYFHPTFEHQTFALAAAGDPSR